MFFGIPSLREGKLDLNRVLRDETTETMSFGTLTDVIGKNGGMDGLPNEEGWSLGKSPSTGTDLKERVGEEVGHSPPKEVKTGVPVRTPTSKDNRDDCTVLIGESETSLFPYTNIEVVTYISEYPRPWGRVRRNSDFTGRVFGRTSSTSDPLTTYFISSLPPPSLETLGPGPDGDTCRPGVVPGWCSYDFESLLPNRPRRPDVPRWTPRSVGEGRTHVEVG